MSENELSKALLRGESPIDLPALTARVLKRDRRRVLEMSIVCVAAWMIVIMLPLAIILPMLAQIGEYQIDINRSFGSATNQQQDQLIHVLQAVKGGTLAVLLSSFGSMFVAAACTVWLIIFSRRATLRQVNARLAEISAILKTLAGPSK